MIAGIDYVSLSTRDYRVKTLNGWGIRAGNKVGEAKETWGITTDCLPMSGKGYFLNLEKAKIDLSPYGIKIDFNPSTILHPFELIKDRKSLIASIDQVKTELDNIGIDLDFDGAGVNRLDLAKQFIVSGGPSAYADVWNTLQGKRMGQNRKQYPDGFEMGNSLRKVVIYHKEKQLREAKGLSIDTPKDLTRAEVRYTKSKSVGHARNGAGIGIVRHLIDSDPQALTETYNRFMLRDVFRTPDGWQTSIDFDTEVDLLKIFKEKHPKSGISNFIQMEGIEIILQRFGGLDLFSEALLRAGYNRSTIHRQMKSMRELIQAKGFIDFRRGESSTSQKVDFLRRLFCA